MSLSIINQDEIAKNVSDSYNGIIPFNEIFYLYSILYSAERCLNSFNVYNTINIGNPDPDKLISLIQEAIGHASALSRYFWPSPAGTKKSSPMLRLRMKRGEKLREYFDLTDDSALANRELRNAWEHYDERLDSFLLNQEFGNYHPKGILESHQLADNPVNQIFKLLDIEAECLILLNKKFFFSNIRSEVEAIYTKTQDALTNGGRLNNQKSES